MLVIGMAALSMASVVAVLRAPMPNRGLWALLALFGTGAITINWTSGAVSAQLFMLQFLSSGAAHAAPAAPWLLTFAFPLGPILAWQRLRAARAAATSPTPTHPGAAI
jgi:hypothetical protein